MAKLRWPNSTMRTSWTTCCATSPTNLLGSGKTSAQQVVQLVGPNISTGQSPASWPTSWLSRVYQPTSCTTSSPDTNLLYNLLADKLNGANLMASGKTRVNICTYRDVGPWQDQRPTSCTTYWALVLPVPNMFVGDVAQQVGQLVRIIEFGHIIRKNYDAIFVPMNCVIHADVLKATYSPSVS
jgi:hypothetical protein